MTAIPPSAARLAARVLFSAFASVGAAGCAASAAPTPAVPANAQPPTANGPLDEAVPPGVDGDLLRMAAKQMDAGQLIEAISTLEALSRRHPDNGFVLHELALAHRLAKHPERAVDVLMPFKDRLPAQTSANLASALDDAGRGAEAVTVLRAAIAKSPRSGLLLSELATTLRRMGEVEEPLGLYLRGTEVDPTFSATYLHLANMLAQSRYRGLALVYGEAFRLLEPSTPRSREMARVMVKVCAESVALEKKGGKTVAHVSLAPDLVVTPGQPPSFPLANAFELAFGKGLVDAHQKGLGLASLHEARRAFLDRIKDPKPLYDWSSVPLFRWLRALDAAGHLEAYDTWLYGPADPEAAERWADGHREAMTAMARWVASHPLFPK